MQLSPIFVEVLPPFDEIKYGEIWISHKHRTINSALSLRMRRPDRPVTAPQPMARSLRRKSGFTARADRRIGVG